MWQDIESVLLDASGAESAAHYPQLHPHYTVQHPHGAYDVIGVKEEPMDEQQQQQQRPSYGSQWQAAYHPARSDLYDPSLPPPFHW